MKRSLFLLSVFSLAAFLLPGSVAHSVDVVEALYTFDDYNPGDPIPDGGLVTDFSGKGRHLVNRRANTTSAAPASGLTAGGTTQIEMSGLDGGTGPRGATDFLEFIPGFSGFSNSGLSAANSPFVFPAGIHWMIEIVASSHNATNGSEGTLFTTGDFDDVGGVDKFSIDLATHTGGTLTNIDVNHDDSDGPGAGSTTPFVRETNVPAPYFMHLAIVRDRQNDRVQIWRDGVLSTCGNCDVGGINGLNDLEDSGGQFYIGPQIIANIEQAAGARLFRGNIDAVKITTRDVFGAGSQFDAADMGDFTHIIPEPSSLALLFGGVLAFVARRNNR